MFQFDEHKINRHRGWVQNRSKKLGGRGSGIFLSKRERRRRRMERRDKNFGFNRIWVWSCMNNEEKKEGYNT